MVILGLSRISTSFHTVPPPPTVKQLRKLSQAQCNNLMGRTALVMWPKLLNSVELDHTITSLKEHLIAFLNQFMQFPIA